MDAMIERVAQAIHDHWQNGGRSWNDTCKRLPAQADDFRAKARAAIEAMREPTDAMLESANAHSRDYFGGETEELYTAMIDAALSEPAQ